MAAVRGLGWHKLHTQPWRAHGVFRATVATWNGLMVPHPIFRGGFMILHPRIFSARFIFPLASFFDGPPIGCPYPWIHRSWPNGLVPGCFKGQNMPMAPAALATLLTPGWAIKLSKAAIAAAIFCRACAVEMHVNISQEPFYIYGNSQEKCRAPEPRTTLCASLRSRNALKQFTRATLYRPQLEPRTRAHTLCEPAQSTCMSTCHKSNFIRKFTGKMPPRSLSPERRHTHFVRACAVEMHFNISQGPLYIYGNSQVKCRRPEARTTLCASLRGRKALQHVTRATLDGILQEKCRTPGPRTALLCEPAQSKFM